MRLGSTVPDFKALTTQGPISFHEWIGSSWCVLFSHPADFTPVCTTELGRIAVHKGEFDRRGVKLIALSCDKLKDHADWVNPGDKIMILPTVKEEDLPKLFPKGVDKVSMPSGQNYVRTTTDYSL